MVASRSSGTWQWQVFNRLVAWDSTRERVSEQASERMSAAERASERMSAAERASDASSAEQANE